jgi:sensor c-di-GMP phosphodiesterase-like protein
MLAMTETLGFPVVVEGVETECQLLFLESTGKPMTVQGFYFGRAVSAATVAALMAAEESKTAVINMYAICLAIGWFHSCLIPERPA